MSDDLIHDREAIRAGWDDDDPDVSRIVRRVGAALNSGRDKAVVDVVLDEVAKAGADRASLADAWEAGHVTRWRRGPDECQCCAYSAGECACGKYGTGELLSLAQNPYRDAS